MSLLYSKTNMVIVMKGINANNIGLRESHFVSVPKTDKIHITRIKKYSGATVTKKPKTVLCNLRPTPIRSK